MKGAVHGAVVLLTNMSVNLTRRLQTYLVSITIAIALYVALSYDIV